MTIIIWNTRNSANTECIAFYVGFLFTGVLLVLLLYSTSRAISTRWV